MSEKNTPEQQPVKRFKYKRLVVAMSLIVISSFITITLAATQGGFYIPSSATPKQSAIELEVTLDGTTWTNATAFDWGEVEEDTTYVKPLDVKNIDNRAAEIILQVVDLPTGYSLVWSKNGLTVNPGETLFGQLILTTPTTITDTTPQTWEMWIHATPLNP